jgi:DNA end-binding protein Ku
MASRAIWKGQLRLSLVSIGVELHSAQKSGEKVSFRQIHEPTGKPIYYEKSVAGIGPVEASDIVKGYEYEKNNFVLLDPEELETIKLESKKTFELVQFVEASEISPLYFDKPYYLVPTDELAEDAYRVVRDALRATDKVGIGQLTMRGKEYLAAVKPYEDGLLLETLHYADEVRRATPLFAAIADKPVEGELLDVANTLIQRKTAPFNPAAFKDHYSEALHDLLEQKLKNKKIKRVSTDKEQRPSGENVIDLMAALKKSLEGTESGDKKPAAKRSASSKTSSSRKKRAS